MSLPGCFGYELDLTQLSPEEFAMIPGQLEDYRKYGPVFHDGDYYRLASYSENGEYDALMAVTRDKRSAPARDGCTADCCCPKWKATF